MLRILAILPFLWAGAAFAAGPVFDVHVHLHDGEKSLLAYEAEAETAGIELAGLGAMWFGGPHQALQGELDEIRAGNDSVIVLAAKYPEVVPIATVHPYDGPAALDELERVAAAGVGVLKIHPPPQRFDVSDPRVETLVRRAAELGMVVRTANANILHGAREKRFTMVLRVTATKCIPPHLCGLTVRVVKTP